MANNFQIPFLLYPLIFGHNDRVSLQEFHQRGIPLQNINVADAPKTVKNGKYLLLTFIAPLICIIHTKMALINSLICQKK
jgi:uncharacterized membrane protein YozB (DUF420 family)